MITQGIDLGAESRAGRAAQLRRQVRSATWLIGAGCQWLLDRIVRALSLSRIHPNALTTLGLALNIVAAVLFGQGRFFAAGLVVITAGLFDMVDGRVARVTASRRSARFLIPSLTAIRTSRSTSACWSTTRARNGFSTSCWWRS